MKKISYISSRVLAALIITIAIYSCKGRVYNEEKTMTSTADHEVSEVNNIQIKEGITSDSSEVIPSNDEAKSPTPAKSNDVNGIERLKAAYPQKIKDIRENTIYFVDGSTMVYDDGKKKDFETMLDNADPEDMFHLAYNTTSTTPEYLHDVGRTRSEQLFKTLYGKSKEEIGKQLVEVNWFGETVKFSSSNNAAEQLKKVEKELSQHPELKKYLKCSGTFYWRNVRGANRLSAHSYGIAIDIGVDNSDYWLWKNKNATETQKITYQNRIPLEIAEIFEKYGFVWGGRWYHYDTMHFEYRPELNPPKK